MSTSITPTAGVTLSYSSAWIPALTTSENRDVQASWVGAGWSFGIEAVEVDLYGTATIEDDEYFYVDGGGGRTPIVRDNSGILRIQNYPYWKISLNIQDDTARLPGQRATAYSLDYSKLDAIKAWVDADA